MSMFGIMKGIAKMVEGVIEQDGAKIAKGALGTAISTAGTVLEITAGVGEPVSQAGEDASDD